MTNKDDAPKSSKARKITHPDMMGDGTEEQNLNQPGDPSARVKKKDVEAALAKQQPKK